jgi:gliding motility-associated-like protein
MKIVKYLFLFVILAICHNSIAQKEANIWHFGDGRCLDFTSGTPVLLPGSSMTTFEGSSSWCDKFGNLLMYTNGGGREPAVSGQDAGHIWNRNNGVMYNMQGTKGGGFSARQSSVIFDAPGQDSVYYVFTMDETEFNTGASAAIQAAQPVGRGLTYFTIDMRLNGGLGGVVLADQRLYTPSYEGLCAIRHANGRDYWVIIHQASIGLGIYSVTPTGVSFIGSYTGAGAPADYTIKASPNGGKVMASFAGLLGASSTPHLLDFDNNTGQLSNPVPFTVTNSIESYEFSPNSRYLYTAESDFFFFPVTESIVQYNLLAPSIVGSAVTIGNVTTPGGFTVSSPNSLQLAPDGKIYFLTIDYITNTNYISRIKCPNIAGASLELNVLNTVSTLSNYYFGLPNFPGWLFENDDQANVSLGTDTIDLCEVGGSYVLNAMNPGATYLWSTGATTQSITVNTPGLYSVTVNDDCGSGTDQVVVVNCNSTTNPFNCDTSGNWFLFGNYSGGELNIIVDKNIPNLKIGICTYEPVKVTFGGAFVGNITDVYYAGFNSNQNNNFCGYPISTTSFVGVNPALTTVAVTPPVNIISPPNPANILNLPNGNNTGVVAISSCNLNTYQGGANTLDQVLDVFQIRFGGSSRGIIIQDCCWVDSIPFRLGRISGQCCNSGPGTATLSYPPGPFCSGAGQLLPSLLGDSSGTFFSYPSGLVIDQITGEINLSGSNPGTYEVIYAVYSNCFTYLFNDTIVISNGNNSVTSITASACNSYTAPWGITYTQSGIYNDTLTNVSGCDSIISLNLSITGTIITPPTTANACNSYTSPWGTVYTQSGLYSDTLTTVNGCDSIVSVNLTITGTIITPTITANACNSYTSPWGTVYTQSGFYSDTLTTVSGCDSIVSVNLTINGTITTPTITANACNSYIAPWGTVYTQSGNYSDTLTTINGCDSILSVNLTITGLPTLSSSIIADSCGKGNGSATLSASGGSALYNYAWSNGAVGSTQTNLNTGVYTVTVTDQNGCASVTQISVPLIAPPIINLNISAISLLEGDSLQLNASGALSYQWSPPVGLSCTNCPNPYASPLQSTTYTVNGTALNGCQSNASVTITIDIRCNELFVPSIFSPNNIGPALNEQLCVFSNCIAEMDFAIYNRWGQLIFQTNDPQKCWNGTHDGKEATSGVYAYRLYVKQLNGIIINKSGNVTLTR